MKWLPDMFFYEMHFQLRLYFSRTTYSALSATLPLSLSASLPSLSDQVRFLRKRQRAKDKKQNMWERLTRAP